MVRPFHVVLAVLALAAPAAAADRPNIIFIFSDDHAYQAISAYGDRLAKDAPTPHLDRIAKEGMLFRNACVTNSICAPSRAVLLTGRHSHLNGVLDNRLPFDGSQQTFPKLLRNAGYTTAIFGKWHLKTEPTGFDAWEVLPGQGHYYNPDFRTPQGNRRVEGYVTDLITDKAIAWLKGGRDASKPFLLMVHHKAPHRTWEPGPRHLDLFKDTTFPEPETLFDDYAGRGTAAKTQDMSIAKTMNLPRDLKVQTPYNNKRMTPEQARAWDAAYGPVNEAFRKANPQGKDLVRWKYQRYMQDYLRCIRAVDENVGRLLDHLDASKLAANTVVVYSSDQGFYLGEHGWFDKRFIYRESFKTPLLVRWPGAVKAGVENDDLVQNLDFAPTFLDLAGVPVPAGMQGASLKPLLQGKRPAGWRTSVYYHYYEFPAVHSVRRHYGVVTKDFKLARFYDARSDWEEWELYDLKKDPREMKSVYGDPAYAKTVTDLKAELKRLRARYQVPEKDPEMKGRSRKKK